jgi:hypothetical protein
MPRRSRAPSCRPEQAAENVAYLRRMMAAQQKGAPALKKNIRSRAVEGLDPVEDGGS